MIQQPLVRYTFLFNPISSTAAEVKIFMEEIKKTENRAPYALESLKPSGGSGELFQSGIPLK